MRGKTEDEILNQRRELENAIPFKDWQVIASYKPEFKDKPKLYALGQSLSMLAEADLLIVSADDYANPSYPGVSYEVEAALDYGVNVYFVNG
jgi:hypothetical protein